MRRLPILLSMVTLALALPACGARSADTRGSTTSSGGDSISTTAAATTTPTTVPTTTTKATTTTTTTTTTTVPVTTTTLLPLEYPVERVDSYIGASARPYWVEPGFQEPGGEDFFQSWGPWPGVAPSWHFMLFRRSSGSGMATDADLLLLTDYSSDSAGTVVDALFVDRENTDPDLWIGLACEDTKPALLVDHNYKPIRAWKVVTGPGPVALIEVDIADLTAAEISSACLNIKHPG